MSLPLAVFEGRLRFFGGRLVAGINYPFWIFDFGFLIEVITEPDSIIKFSSFSPCERTSVSDSDLILPRRKAAK
jgi:hypothetical protein